MDAEIRFTKVKYDGSKVRLEYEKVRKDGDPDEFVLHSADQPAPELEAALQALAIDVVTICELIPSDTERLKVRGVTLTHSHDIPGVVVTALKTLQTSNAPLVLNTPHLPEQSYSGNEDEPTMPTGMYARLCEIEAQAHRYLRGDRAQGALFEMPAPQATTEGEAVPA